MESWLEVATRGAILVIDAMALIVVAVGTIEAFVAGLRMMLRPQATDHERRMIWLRVWRWLVAGLTFQLAADIIETSIAPGWEDVGRLAAIAGVRTFLNYFLERDLAEAREREREARSAAGEAPRRFAPPPPGS